MDPRQELAEARRELAEYQGENLSRCCACRFDDGKLTTECLQHAEMRKALEAERAGAGALRKLLAEVEWVDDLDETACPTGGVSCRWCDGGGVTKPGRGRKKADPQHNLDCPFVAAMSSTAGQSLLAAHAAEIESLKDELAEMSTAHAETVTGLREACAQELEWRIAVENRADAADKEVAGLRQALEQERARAAAMEAELRKWIAARNSLSADCLKLGIGSGAGDSGKWGDELARRCEPLREWCERHLVGNESTAGQSLLAAHASEVAGLRGEIADLVDHWDMSKRVAEMRKSQRDAAVERLRALVASTEGFADSALSSGWVGLGRNLHRSVVDHRAFLATLATPPATEADKPGGGGLQSPSTQPGDGPNITNKDFAPTGDSMAGGSVQ